MTTTTKKPATIPQALLLAFLTADPSYTIRCYGDFHVAEFHAGDEKLPGGRPNATALKSCAAHGWVTLSDVTVGTTTWTRSRVTITEAGRAALVAAAQAHGAAFADEERRFRTGLACRVTGYAEGHARAVLRKSSEELGAAFATLDTDTRERVRLAIESVPGFTQIEIGTLLKLHYEAADALRAAEAARDRARAEPAPERVFAA